MTFHRKVGGIHWFAIGRVRIAFCIKHKTTTIHHQLGPYEIAIATENARIAEQNYKAQSNNLEDQIKHHVLKTYCTEERNIFGGF